MATVKTAISLQKPLYEEATKLARKLKIPRSRLVSNALTDYLRRRETQALIDGLNAAYADGLDPGDKKMLDAALRMQAKRTQGDEW